MAANHSIHPRGTLLGTAFGPVTILADESHLLSVHFSDLGYRDSSALLLEARRQMEAYLTGALHCFDLPIRPLGTTRELQVWSALREIPYGETVSYRDLALQIGAPGGHRIVGGANGKNPLPMLIPCHRVIAVDGKIGGYKAGVPIKKGLLELEQRYRPVH